MESNYVDVLVVGAGVSGIGAGYHLQDKCADKTYAILEAREGLGGTWDLFRYPGIRSDSDMYTFGYSFKPWTNAKTIADGPSILAYLRDTVSENGIDRHILFQHRVLSAAWSTEQALWTVQVERGPAKELVNYTCRFLYLCAGYYNFEHGYVADFPGREKFKGRIVHPQKWDDDIDYSGQRVVVIGSGATAVTLIPELARKAAHVIMLQRSPTYMMARPTEDRLANLLRKILPESIAYAVNRWMYVLLTAFFFKLSRAWPRLVRKILIAAVGRELGPGHDLVRDYTPRYQPWDQRVCLVPDGDLFQAVKNGKASVVTDRITAFTAGGILLESGRELEADLIVTATGLEIRMLGAIDIVVDGTRPDLSKCLQYKGLMFSGIPNLASCFGYTNASWTLKADLVSEYLCRLLKHMDETGTRQCTPSLNDPSIETEPFIDFSSGYFQRAMDELPKQGSRRPWKLHQNYLLDIAMLRLGRIDDGVIVFENPSPTAAASTDAR